MGARLEQTLGDSFHAEGQAVRTDRRIKGGGDGHQTDSGLCHGVRLGCRLSAPSGTRTAVPQRDGSHDFDFLIGDWKAHVRVLRNRLDGSNNPKDWVEYDGISNHKKLLDSNANFEEFDAYCGHSPVE
jgi:hypothetical protein